ncbi:zona pellucida sperm-binding protein 4-like [Gastrophryne carolinensis]
MDAPTPEECSNIPTQRRLPCDGHSMSQEHCLQSCCYDPLDSVTPCYYGNKVTIQCTGDGQFSVAISKDVTVPPLNLPSVRLLRGSGPECAPVAQNEAFVFFSFPLLACETTHIEDGTSLVYENYFVAEKEKTGRGSLISRDSTFRLHIHCSFVASDSQVHQSVEVFTLTPPPHVTSAGSLTLEMRIAKALHPHTLPWPFTDSIYGQYYSSEEYPIIKFLGDPVYFEVCILNRNDPTLLLKLEQCWATASEKPFSQPQWRILVDGCPFTGDQYMTQAVTNGDIEVPNPTHYKRFIVHTFTFIGTVSHNAIGRPVYFHCSASVCVPSAAERCATSCPTKRRRALASMRLVMLVSAEGPVAFYVRKKDKLNEGNDGGRSSNLDWMLAIIPGSIFVVILLLLIVLTKIKL